MIGFCRIQLLNKGKNNIPRTSLTPAKSGEQIGWHPSKHKENNNAH
jgi:hypothetical protein